jgi:hypothetical protein
LITEQPAGRPDERSLFAFFFRTGRFANEHDLGAAPTFASKAYDVASLV